MFLDNHDSLTIESVAMLLQKLRNGESVELGPFSDQVSDTTQADNDALLLDDIIEELRSKSRG